MLTARGWALVVTIALFLAGAVLFGVQELYQSYVDNGLTLEEFTGSSYLRIKRVQELQAAGQVDDELRWLAPVRAAL